MPAFEGLLDSESDGEFDFLQPRIQLPHHAHTMRTVNATGREPAQRSTEHDPKLAAILISRPQACGSQIKYLPLCSTHRGNGKLTVLPSSRERIDSLQNGAGSTSFTYQPDMLPVEMFDLIVQHLARDDVKAMRLVSHEFEQKVSRALFQSAVVPFNTELYDMIDEDTKTNNRVSQPRVKGKGRARADSNDNEASGGLQWLNAKDDREGKVYKGHGLKVFQGFGPHIKRFGMSFEVAEHQLSQPPVKKDLDKVQSYHGAYEWPPPYYERFANLAGLERTADDTSRMRAAFSKLKHVQELGLSIDSGLGWLSGQDRSIRAHIFDQPSSVFGSSWTVPDRVHQSAREFWDALQQSHASFAATQNVQSNLKETTLMYRSLEKGPHSLDGLRGTSYSNTQRWPSIEAALAAPDGNASLLTSHRDGVLYASNAHASLGIRDIAVSFDRPAVIPNDLRKEQKEWLLETEWAQRAFLESYMLAVTDNFDNFQNVTTLNIAKLSNQFVPMLAKEAFWDALPFLEDVTIHVKPDWRTVFKDEAGLAATAPLTPSRAVDPFHKLLRSHIAGNESIKKLSVGWASGGEHADGTFARFNHLLPAPITSSDHSMANSSHFNLVFPHLEQLTLYNCWITPPALEGLVKSHSGRNLTKLKLDSVSLTAHPKFPAGAQHGVAHHQQFPWMHNMNNAGFVGAHAFGNGGMNNNHMAAALQQQNLHQQQQLQLLNLQLQQQQLQQQLHLHQMAAANNGQPAWAMNLNNGNNANFNAHFPPLGMAGPANQPGPAAPANAPGAAPLPSHWTVGHREGSWPQVLDSISPGRTFDDFIPHELGFEPIPRPPTNLTSIAFKSCGYARFVNTTPPFDQLVLESADYTHHATPWFRSRLSALKSTMMEIPRDRLMAGIIQFMPRRELDALQLGWQLREGWEDEWLAEASTYDGYLPGGTGRFSGKVSKTT